MVKTNLFQLISAVVVLILTQSPGYSVSAFRQVSVPAKVQSGQGAVLDENDSFFIIMTTSQVRGLAKTTTRMEQRDPEGDRRFVIEHASSNGDYWYWAHQQLRDALAAAVSRHPQRAIEMIDRVVARDHIVPEMEWITAPEFKAYLRSCESDDLLYYLDPMVAIEVFLTNHIVSKLERVHPRLSGGRNPYPIPEIVLSDLLATPQPGENPHTVGLAKILGMPASGNTDYLAPDSDLYEAPGDRYLEKSTMAEDPQFKSIPVASQEIKRDLEKLMANTAPYQQFLQIQGSIATNSRAGTVELSDDLGVVINTQSPFYEKIKTYRDIFKDAPIKTAQ